MHVYSNIIVYALYDWEKISKFAARKCAVLYRVVH